MKSVQLVLFLSLAVSLVACGDDNTPIDMNGDAGCGFPAPEGAPQFDVISEVPSYVVLGSNFDQSAFIGWLGAEGDVINGNWINSGTTAPGLVSTLSSDIATPTRLPGDGTYYYIDREGTDVVTRVSIPAGVVIGQVRTHGTTCGGFTSNPYDIAVISETQALVTRYASAPGATPECRGGDLIEIDPSTMTRTGNTVDLSSFEVDVQVRTKETMSMPSQVVTRRVLPRPAHTFLMDNGLVAVTLERLSDDYAGSAFGVLALIDPVTRSIKSHVVIDGLKNCGSISPVPGQPNSVVVVCTGYKPNDVMDTNEPDKHESAGIVVYDVTSAGVITELSAWRANDHLADPNLAGDAQMLDATHALAIRRGAYASPTDPDALYLVDLTTDTFTLVASAGQGYGFYSGIAFDSASRLALVPDLDAGVRRFTVDATFSSATELETVAGVGVADIPVRDIAFVDIGTALVCR